MNVDIVSPFLLGQQKPGVTIGVVLVLRVVPLIALVNREIDMAFLFDEDLGGVESNSDALSVRELD